MLKFVNLIINYQIFSKNLSKKSLKKFSTRFSLNFFIKNFSSPFKPLLGWKLIGGAGESCSRDNFCLSWHNSINSRHHLQCLLASSQFHACPSCCCCCCFAFSCLFCANIVGIWPILRDDVFVLSCPLNNGLIATILFVFVVHHRLLSFVHFQSSIGKRHATQVHTLLRFDRKTVAKGGGGLFLKKINALIHGLRVSAPQNCAD